MILDQIALHSVQYRFQLNFMNILRQLLEEKAPVNNVKEDRVSNAEKYDCK